VSPLGSFAVPLIRRLISPVAADVMMRNFGPGEVLRFPVVLTAEKILTVLRYGYQDVDSAEFSRLEAITSIPPRIFFLSPKLFLLCDS